MRRALSPAFALLALLWTGTTSATVEEFGTTGGGGRLRLDRSERSVRIDVMGVNGHSCLVKGALSGAQLDRVDSESCRFQLRRQVSGALTVVVDAAAREACQENCGARAWFEGDYLPLPPACTPASLNATQGRGLKAYQSQQHEVAFQLWSQTLATCEKTMSWHAVWRWRNDAAIAAARAGRTTDCQRLSQAVVDDAQQFTLPGDSEPFAYAPTDAITARPLIAAARHNLTRCAPTP